MRFVWLWVLALACVGFNAAADESEDAVADCDPKCRRGYTCTEGKCVAQSVCTPRCRKGFSCVDSQCVSNCNPPCAHGETCGDDGECRKLSTERWEDQPTRSRKRNRADDEDSAREKTEKKDEDTKPEKYEPSVVRIYAGPAAYAIVVNSAVGAAGGVSLAIHLHPEEARVFVIGMRGVILADSSGILGQVGGDLGVRIPLYGARRVGIGLLAVITPGGFVISLANGGSVAGFHFGGLFGPYFDFGAFTLQTTIGPAFIAQKNAVALFESTLEFGVRF